MPMMYNWNGWNGDWGGMFLVMLLNAVVWIALIGSLIWFLVWAVSRLSTRPSPSSGHLDAGLPALEILRQRYARGEIDETTFERMRERLEASARRGELSIPPGR